MSCKTTLSIGLVTAFLKGINAYQETKDSQIAVEKAFDFVKESKLIETAIECSQEPHCDCD